MQQVSTSCPGFRMTNRMMQGQANNVCVISFLEIGSIAVVFDDVRVRRRSLGMQNVAGPRAFGRMMVT